jgi:hypothetical protein
MGQITIEIPQKFERTYRIISEDSADEVLRKLDVLVKEANHIEDDGILGLWADREESAEEISRKLRKGWNRNMSDD